MTVAWVVLLLSGVLEAVWATALGASDGFTRLGPSAVVVVALAGSMVGLGYAMRSIPVGTAYAVWVGIGVALTVAWAMATRTEQASAARLVCVALIVAGVVGLKLVS